MTLRGLYLNCRLCWLVLVVSLFVSLWVFSPFACLSACLGGPAFLCCFLLACLLGLFGLCGAGGASGAGGAWLLALTRLCTLL